MNLSVAEEMIGCVWACNPDINKHTILRRHGTSSASRTVMAGSGKPAEILPFVPETFRSAQLPKHCPGHFPAAIKSTVDDTIP
ncbi:hypothetical protein CCR75_004246 [Bremia lactucae]|uniref:Uncharacterized protein n=1 Tax=Bremia lactucae TaxID=4779 RepID=A0A976FHT1_BRELC|nr:hypothetical protein CCR75_004246 [Bremia lactucae]